MKYIEIANRIEKTAANESYVDLTEFGYELNVQEVPDIQEERIKAYWIGKWLCTDTEVGYRMYFFDGKPFAFSEQEGRKSDEHFSFFDQALAMEIKEYLVSLLIRESDHLRLNLVDINEDPGDCFGIDFNAQIMRTDLITYRGQKVEIVERIKNKPYGIDDELRIKLPDEQIIQVNIKELHFGFHLNPDAEAV